VVPPLALLSDLVPFRSWAGCTTNTFSPPSVCVTQFFCGRQGSFAGAAEESGSGGAGATVFSTGGLLTAAVVGTVAAGHVAKEVISEVATQAAERSAGNRRSQRAANLTLEIAGDMCRKPLSINGPMGWNRTNDQRINSPTRHY
jgi:hypothetical protein